MINLRGLLGCILILSNLMVLGPLSGRADSPTVSPSELGQVDSTIELPVPFDCSRAFCGCWSEAELKYTTTVNDESGHPLQGIELRCDSESDPIAISDKDGDASFTIITQQSPGCGYRRCNHLTFSDTRGLFKTLNAVMWATNDNVTVLQGRERPNPGPPSQ